MTSGFSALAAALVLGPRKDWRQSENRPANVPFVILGTALLWFGWYDFFWSVAPRASLHPLAFTLTQLTAPTTAQIV